MQFGLRIQYNVRGILPVMVTPPILNLLKSLSL